jgi:hypothetical protein
MSNFQHLQRSSRLCLGHVATTWHSLLGTIFGSYRPERHYMRGPGPKWRAKHRGA